jgi:transcriptional regulator with XRE-family HTH domain/Zn-dependent peptidase ImmA (M78 family)
MLKEENIRLLFGVKLKQLRLERKKTITEVAELSGISMSYLTEIEKGKKYPKANKISILAEVLDVSYDSLVSLQLDKNLLPLAEFFKSDLLSTLPLEIFGIEPSDLLDILASQPSKIAAFVSTLGEMARNYNMSVEHFYHAVLRSYQEMHENYFEDLENEAKKCFETYKELRPFASLEGLKKLLITHFNYEIEETNFEDTIELKYFRAIFISQKQKLLINSELSESKKTFALCRELGYAVMNIKDRPMTSSMLHLQSFEQLLNNFKASYFASALIIPEDLLVADMQKFFKHKAFRADELTMLIHKYNASPEMFFHRLTNLLPKFFDLKQLFFLRFHHNIGSEIYDLNKELHLAGLYNPHGSTTQENYCRRWISLNILKDLEQNPTKKIFSKAQRSKYIDSENEFFCLSMAYQASEFKTCSVTIGFLMTDILKDKVNFWEDAQVPIKQVGVTCQRCSNLICGERVAPPTVYEAAIRTQKIEKALDNLIKKV